MSDSVSSLPPITGIKDPAVRAYLQALTTAWDVRNGQSRHANEKFLTVADIQKAVDQVMRGGKADVTRVSGDLAQALHKLVNK